MPYVVAITADLGILDCFCQQVISWACQRAKNGYTSTQFCVLHCCLIFRDGCAWDHPNADTSKFVNVLSIQASLVSYTRLVETLQP